MKPVASILGIPQENIFANQLLFGSSGEFLGFDANEPTSRSGGKATAVKQIKKAHGYKALTMVGDGATDFEVWKILHILWLVDQVVPTYSFAMRVFNFEKLLLQKLIG
ncbi:HAD-like superfamily [Sesbania bispinosa]|nr:HAD-like superfamily [Sesbania bispinosa]